MKFSPCHTHKRINDPMLPPTLWANIPWSSYTMMWKGQGGMFLTTDKGATIQLGLSIECYKSLKVTTPFFTLGNADMSTGRKVLPKVSINNIFLLLPT